MSYTEYEHRSFWMISKKFFFYGKAGLNQIGSLTAGDCNICGHPGHF